MTTALQEKQGYKKTELGWIPEDWEVVKIGDLCQVKRGASPRPINDLRWWGNRAGWVRISDVTASRKYLNSTQTYLSEEGIKQSVKVNKGEVILSICATMGVPIIVNMDACIHDGFVWFDKLTQEIDREFLYYFLQYNTAKLASNKQTGTQGNLNTSIISNARIPFMKKPEQEKIAEILSTVDEKIEKVEKQIEQAEQLKKALTQKLFTKGIGHTEFKESDLGTTPSQWNVVSQSEVATFYNGRAYKLSEWEKQGTPVIRLQNLTGTGNEYYYSRLNLPEHQYVYNGEILYMWSATFGVHIWKGEKAIYHYHIWKVNPNEKYIDKLFMYYSLEKITNQLKQNTHGATMLHLTKTGMEEYKIALPTIPEQQKIAEILSSADEKIEILQNKKSEYEKLKKGLMQKLLTGQIRVRV